MLSSYDRLVIVGLVDRLKPDTQHHRILRAMLDNNDKVEVWKLIAPRPTGLGAAQYNARIKELREMLDPMGYEIKNKAGREFYLEVKPPLQGGFEI